MLWSCIWVSQENKDIMTAVLAWNKRFDNFSILFYLRTCSWDNIHGYRYNCTLREIQCTSASDCFSCYGSFNLFAILNSNCLYTVPIVLREKKVWMSSLFWSLRVEMNIIVYINHNILHVHVSIYLFRESLMFKTEFQEFHINVFLFLGDKYI